MGWSTSTELLLPESNPRDPLAGIEEVSLLDVPPPPRLIMPSVWLATAGSAESTTGSSRTAGAPVGERMVLSSSREVLTCAALVEPLLPSLVQEVNLIRYNDSLEINL